MCNIKLQQLSLCATIIDLFAFNMLIYERVRFRAKITVRSHDERRKLEFRHSINFFSVRLETLWGEQAKREVESDKKDMKFFVFFLVTLFVINFDADAVEIECKFHE